MHKSNHAKKKREIIQKIVDQFVIDGAEFTCLASFRYLKGFAVKSVIEAGDDYCFSKSNYFPLTSAGDNFVTWAAKHYYETIYLKKD
jgi:hypothetical protein